MSCIFEPVPSRRLGRSLGIDLVPFKTCTYDCVYCHIGRTTCQTMERRGGPSMETILRELTPRLSATPDYITLSGSGEPTLFIGLDALIKSIKQLTRIPVAVITNGSLLWDPTIQRELLAADVVLPSLDAGDPAIFQRINRPLAQIDFERMVKGLIDFRRLYRGQYWLEIMLVRGLNDGDDSLAVLRAWVARIAPDKVHLNTVVRPPADSGIQAVPSERLQEIAAMFSPPADVIADFRAPKTILGQTGSAEEILAMLQRRPCTLEDIAAGLNISPTGLAKQLAELQGQGRICVNECNGRRFFSAVGTAPASTASHATPPEGAHA